MLMGASGITGHRHGPPITVACWGPSGRVEIAVAAGQACHRGGQDNRVEERGAAGPISGEPSRADFADRRRLSCRHQIPDGCAGRCQRSSAVRSARDTVSRVWRKVKGDWERLECPPRSPRNRSSV